MANAKRVALLIEPTNSHNQGILSGVKEYILKQRPSWIFHGIGGDVQLLKDWEADAAIVQATTAQLEDELLRWGGPCVNVATWLEDQSLPSVQIDSLSIGQMAAKYFIAQGFRHFAFAGNTGIYYARQRLKGFREVLQQSGLTCSNLYEDRPPPGDPFSLSWVNKEKWLGPWLVAQPRPFALFAANDMLAWELAEVCRLNSLRIPTEAALLGVDNETYCELAIPTLSSIENNKKMLGYQAAAMLDAWLSGKKPSSTPVLIPPVGLVNRESTDALALEDPELAKAIRFIHKHFAQSVGVDELAKHASVSRRSLERKFQSTLGRSPREEIQRVRLERAKALLAQTTLGTAPIAQQTGFSNPQRLSNVFKSATGMTPMEYRQKFQTHSR